MIEVKQEGTIVVLYVDGKANQCYLMHEFAERVHLLIEAQLLVRKRYEQENAQRRVLRQSTVTFESYVRKTCGKNVVDYVLFDGSTTHPLLWPRNLVELS